MRCTAKIQKVREENMSRSTEARYKKKTHASSPFKHNTRIRFPAICWIPHSNHPRSTRHPRPQHPAILILTTSTRSAVGLPEQQAGDRRGRRHAGPGHAPRERERPARPELPLDPAQSVGRRDQGRRARGSTAELGAGARLDRRQRRHVRRWHSLKFDLQQSAQQGRWKDEFS